MMIHINVLFLLAIYEELYCLAAVLYGRHTAHADR